MLAATISFRSPTFSAFTTTPGILIVSLGPSKSNLRTASLSFMKAASPFKMTCAPENERSRRMQFLGMACTCTMVSICTRFNFLRISSERTILSSFRFNAFTLASNREPNDSIRSSGGLCVNWSVIIAKSCEFIYGSMFVTRAETKNMIG